MINENQLSKRVVEEGKLDEKKGGENHLFKRDCRREDVDEMIKYRNRIV